VTAGIKVEKIVLNLLNI